MMTSRNLKIPRSFNILFALLSVITLCSSNSLPLVVNTWRFTNATQTAWNLLLNGGTGLDALEAGCSKCEEMQCDGTVGYGGSPDENSETALDAMIFDGLTMNMGAVAGMRRVKHATSVARHVLENTKHSLLVGSLATQFAVQMGFREESLATTTSKNMWKDWKENKCQPNFWMDVTPDPQTSCGPYKPLSENSIESRKNLGFDDTNHDTIGMIVIDKDSHVVACTSTNGAKYKIPGRVGDSPIPGAGAYADNAVGAAVATGDGDVMMRFLPSFLAVEEMRRGKTPKEAANIAFKRIVDYYPSFMGGIVAVNAKGEHGASCNGMAEFPYSIANSESGGVAVKTIKC